MLTASGASCAEAEAERARSSKHYKFVYSGLGTGNAGEIAGVSRGTIKRWCRHFGLPHQLTRSGQRRIDRAALDRWLIESKPAPKQQRPGYVLNARDDTKGGVIYAIIDPRPERDGQIRYIGKTENYRRRQGDYRRGKLHSRPLQSWFAKLDRLGLRPIFKVVDECLFGLCTLERKWIAKGHKLGWPLLNLTEGGEGQEWDQSLRERASRLSKQKWEDPEYRRRHEEAMLNAALTGRRKIGAEFGAAARSGMSIEQYRERKEERDRKHRNNVRQYEANMAKAAARKREREAVRVPLTHKGSAFVPLTRALWAIVDVNDWELVSRFHWYAAPRHGRFIPRSKAGGQMTQLNRIIMGVDAHAGILHKNRNTLDCRRNNMIVKAARVPKKPIDATALRRTLEGVQEAAARRPSDLHLKLTCDGILRRLKSA